MIHPLNHQKHPKTGGNNRSQMGDIMILGILTLKYVIVLITKLCSNTALDFLSISFAGAPGDVPGIAT